MADKGDKPAIGLTLENPAGGSKARLDLSGPAVYTESVDWVRDHVVLKDSAQTSAVIEIDVNLPERCTVSLFMDPNNHYILGFRGADKVYLLDDSGTAAFAERLVETKLVRSRREITVLHGLKASHEGLGTFTRQVSGLRSRTFSEIDLRSSRCLADYSLAAKEMTFETLKAPLSLLVCMIAESARIPMMKRDFTNLFYGHKVIADEAVRSYDDAKYLIQFAAFAFPEYPHHSGVEKLQKRAAELDGLVREIESAIGGSNRQTLLQEILMGRAPPGGAAVTGQIRRFRDMAAELGVRDPGSITQLISTCRSESAVRAAKLGVAIPAVPSRSPVRPPERR